MKLKKNVFLLVTLISISVSAQNDTIHINNNKLVINNLESGKSKYIVYMERPDGTLINLSIWERETILEENKIIIIQNWKSQDTLWNRYVYSESKRSNFEPIYHYSKWGKNIEAFNFSDVSVKGTDSINNNTKIGFQKNYQIKPLNWELDMEIFKTFSYAVGKTLVVNFYHPGGESPSNFYNYKIVRKEKLKMVSGIDVECWVVEIQYADDDKATFWVSTTSNEVLKMLQHYKQFNRYKIKF